MERIVERVSFDTIVKPKKTRIAAYARVSSGKDEMLHSLSSQISYYTGMIQNHPGWEFVGIYSDEAFTGTKENRPGFQKMLEDCRNGKIDLVIVKSISRLARNTVTLLETARELKSLGIDIFFEEQNIHTLSSEGELMLTILASYAQEESLSVSENQKWKIRKCFEEGRPWSMNMLGYRQINGNLIIVPEEAEIVRHIYKLYLSGLGIQTVTNRINSEGFRTRSGGEFQFSHVQKILKNETYAGNLMLQRKYRTDYITKRTAVNRGELPKYHALNTHEAIIPLPDFIVVQIVMHKRAEKYAPKPRSNKSEYPFSRKITCEKCGKHYVRKQTQSGPVWLCSTYDRKGKSACASKRIPESVLEQLTADQDMNEITEITVCEGNILNMHYSDGTSLEKTWRDRSRSESWTEEMRRCARVKRLEREHNGKKYNSNTRNKDKQKSA